MITKPLIRFKSKDKSEMTKKEYIKNEIHNSDVTMEKILNAKKIKYVMLDELFTELPPKIKNITFYIDLYDIIRDIYIQNIGEELLTLSEKKKLFISSSIINMIGHLRKYFLRHYIKTKFIFFYSTKKAKNEINEYENYKDSFYHTRLVGLNTNVMKLNAIVMSNIKLCEILSNYLPHAYFVNSEEINPTLVPYHFIKGDPLSTNIIYTNDKTNINNCLLNDKTFILTYNYNKIVIYGKNDLLNFYISNKKEVNKEINPELIPYMFSISGYKKYSVEGLPSYAELKAYNLFERLINNGTLSNIKYAPEIFLNDIVKYKKINEDNLKIIKRNLNLFVPELMYDKLTLSDKLFLDKKITDLQDIKSLVDINDQYYSSISRPIYLEDLLLGEDYESLT